MDILLETQRLIIKTPELSDFENLYALHTDAEVMQYIEHGVLAQAEVMDSLKKAIASQERHGFSFGCVFEKTTGLFIGRAGLMYLDHDDTQPDIEIGYSLIRKAWNKGYGTELAQALIEWGFQHIKTNRLVAVMHPNNDRSRLVLEKAKMNYVGRTHYRNIEVALYEIHQYRIDFTKIKLSPATLDDYPVIQNLARFYVYDMSHALGMRPGWEMPEDGLYECIPFLKYWEDKESYPYIIRYENEIAGFVIVDKKGSHKEIQFNMAQFYIVNKFKNKGFGKHVAFECFNRYRGMWEVMVLPGNEAAYRFWRAIIKDYTQDTFIEYTRRVAHLDENNKNIFQFCS